MRDPFKKLLSNVKSTVKVRPRRRTVNKSGVAAIPYEELPVEITAQDIKDLFNEQNGKCAMLGTQLDPQNVFVSKHPLAPSVDRIDNTKGYVPGNIQICSRFANFGKCSYPNEKMDPIIQQIREGFASEKKWWKFWA